MYFNDGLTKPTRDYQDRLVTVDRTYALDAAYDDIEAGRWQLMLGSAAISTGEFPAQMKAPKL